MQRSEKMIWDEVFVEVECAQWIKDGQNVCGDAFASCRISEENRLIAALADGLGSGVKANILAKMTATMSLRFSAANRNIERFSKIMMDSLPVCRVRQISYSTFTILDCQLGGEAKLVEQGNPLSLLVRCNKLIPLKRRSISGEPGSGREMFSSKFFPVTGDRLIVFSDGVAQAGIGGNEHPFGWGEDGCAGFVLQQINDNLGISARELSLKVRNEALKKWPECKALDDISCAVIYFRKPRRTVVLSGPPFDVGRDGEFARRLLDANVRKIICGGTTAQIVSRELNRPLEVLMDSASGGLPPRSRIRGADTVTEGILTLTRAAQYLEEGKMFGDDPAMCLVRELVESDQIEFVIGTRVNEAHQDPTLPVDLEMRRNIVRRISNCLKDKYMKLVQVEYI